MRPLGSDHNLGHLVIQIWLHGLHPFVHIKFACTKTPTSIRLEVVEEVTSDAEGNRERGFVSIADPRNKIFET